MKKNHDKNSTHLKHRVGVSGAVMLGLGSIVGTGVFVSIGIATGITGSLVIFATIIGALVAAFNGLSSAQLAANHPVSGGTYEYGYRWLRPEIGFSAGWMFLCAKCASAATAALGFALYLQYLLNAVQIEIPLNTKIIALFTVVATTLLVLSGLRRSSNVNTAMVSMTLATLIAFIIAGAITASKGNTHFSELLFPSVHEISFPHLFEASALMFVAYTGYGRIATLGEEIHDPSINIPRAIIATLVVSAVLYIAVASIGILSVGPEVFGGIAGSANTDIAPLAIAAKHFGIPGMQWIVSIGAATAMLGVLLNLILGISRVVLAMGRRGDLPAFFARIDSSGNSPYSAVLLVSTTIFSLVLIADIKTTWSFSAFTVLIYYSITNLSALQLNEEERLYSRLIPFIGLISCLLLAFWVKTEIWLTGLIILFIGLLWHFIRRKLR